MIPFTQKVTSLLRVLRSRLQIQIGPLQDPSHGIHGIKINYVGIYKLCNGTGLVQVPLVWKSHYVTCIPALFIPYHVTGLACSHRQKTCTLQNCKLVVNEYACIYWTRSRSLFKTKCRGLPCKLTSFTLRVLVTKGPG